MAVYESALLADFKPLVALMAMLAKHDDPDNLFPSVSTLARLLSVSPATIKRRLKLLRAAKVLVPLTSMRIHPETAMPIPLGGRNHPTRYHLNLDSPGGKKSVTSDTLSPKQRVAAGAERVSSGARKGVNSDTRRSIKEERRSIKSATLESVSRKRLPNADAARVKPIPGKYDHVTWKPEH